MLIHIKNHLLESPVASPENSFNFKDKLHAFSMHGPVKVQYDPYVS